jgi:hypothetical protein
MQEALMEDRGDPNASQEVDGTLLPAVMAVPMAPLVAPANEFDRPALLWDPLSDVSWPRTEELNWQREIVLELRRITAHLKNL